MISAEAFLAEQGRKTEASLEAYLRDWAGAPPRLMEAIRYSLLAPAKRLRPALVLGAAELVSGDDAPALPAACAIEMIHTYSLIHDDLPCMDDDAVRRGQPSCHVVFGEAMAMLAGDTLLTLAFDVLSDTGNIEVLREVARAAGPLGMAGGQVLDLEGEGAALSLDSLRRMHAMKTGALIRASVRSGAMLVGAAEDVLVPLTRYGEHLGLGFQIADDVLDESGEPAVMGKSAGRDRGRHKSTYPASVGLETARRLAEEAIGEAVHALDEFGPEADALRSIAEYTIIRER